MTPKALKLAEKLRKADECTLLETNLTWDAGYELRRLHFSNEKLLRFAKFVLDCAKAGNINSAPLLYQGQMQSLQAIPAGVVAEVEGGGV